MKLSRDAVTIVLATHQRLICAIVLSINGSSINGEGFGCNAIIDIASRDLGPHSLEWGT